MYHGLVSSHLHHIIVRFQLNCTLACSKLNIFEKIEVAINEFQKFSTVPSHIWLRYLKALKVVTQTPAEWEVFKTKCSLALASFYGKSKMCGSRLNKQPPTLLHMNQMTNWLNLLSKA